MVQKSKIAQSYAQLLGSSGFLRFGWHPDTPAQELPAGLHCTKSLHLSLLVPRERDHEKGNPGKLCDSVLPQLDPEAPLSLIEHDLLIVKPKKEEGTPFSEEGGAGTVLDEEDTPPQPASEESNATDATRIGIAIAFAGIGGGIAMASVTYVKRRRAREAAR